MNRSSDLNLDNSLTTPLITINPSDELIFQLNDLKSIDVCQSIQLTNVSDASLAYKVK